MTADEGSSNSANNSRTDGKARKQSMVMLLVPAAAQNFMVL